MLHLDEGYMFGLGAFETIAVYNSTPILLSYHLERLEKALSFFHIDKKIKEKDVHDFIFDKHIINGVVKIMVSKENTTFTTRENPYTEEDYQKGFTLDFSKVTRNESSPLTYYKSLNYGDNILEKRLAAQRNIDEPIFLNSRGEICEGACSNIFFVVNKTPRMIYTPKTSCGLLEGTMRRYVLNNHLVTETIIRPKDIGKFNEVFITNSVMGIMPVSKLGDRTYSSRIVTNKVMKYYKEYMDSFLL